MKTKTVMKNTQGGMNTPLKKGSSSEKSMDRKVDDKKKVEELKLGEE